MGIIFGDDPVLAEVDRILSLLDNGTPIDDSVERQLLDLKEEHGRRGPSGELGPSDPENQAAAKELAGAAVCMSNTPGGGALLVGVADDGTLLGTDLDAEWLRHRIYELTNRALTVDARPVTVAGVRVLVLVMHQAIEPIRWNEKIRWRVGPNCVEVDASTWHARRMAHEHFDWSTQESFIDASSVRPAALEQAREFLRLSGEPSALAMADAKDSELLSRLNVVSGEGKLTNAGVIAFVGREDPSVDYLRRDVAGGDSTHRVRRSGRSLLEELAEVFAYVDANNGRLHLSQGLSIGQFRVLPTLAIREAIVNGVAHRDWGSSGPTVVEHVGRTLRVTSPGGFVGGVNEANIITHPSKSRNRALTELLAALRVAEREGIGVDRMVREMIQVGHQPPDIREIAGPYVRTSLIGDALDEAWITWLREISPPTEGSDLNSLLLLRRLTLRSWVDVTRAAPILQLTIGEARGALQKLATATMAGQPIIDLVAGVPPGAEPAWRLTKTARDLLTRLDSQFSWARPVQTREEVALDYAKARGRLSTTELGSIVGASGSNLGGIMKALEAEGHLAPSRESRRGKGFYYRYVEAPTG